MRDFYGKYFKINANERISDKKMLINVITTVMVVVVCLAMMSMAVLSYYNASISTGKSTISLARSNFKINVTAVYNDSPNVSDDPLPGIKKINDYQTDVNFSKSGRIYKVTLEMEGEVNKETGYCSILIGDRNGGGATFETVQFGKGIKEGNNTINRTSITFFVEINNSISISAELPITFRITSTWGTSANTSDSKINSNSSITINSRSSSSNWNVVLS